MAKVSTSDEKPSKLYLFFANNRYISVARLVVIESGVD